MTVSLKLTLYFADWCGHCKDFKENWEVLKELVKKINNEYNGVSIEINQYEDAEIKQNKKLGKINGKAIEGFPTLVFRPQLNDLEKDYEYIQKRDPMTILNMIKNVCGGLAKKK